MLGKTSGYPAVLSTRETEHLSRLGFLHTSLGRRLSWIHWSKRFLKVFFSRVVLKGFSKIWKILWCPFICVGLQEGGFELVLGQLGAATRFRPGWAWASRELLRRVRGGEGSLKAKADAALRAGSMPAGPWETRGGIKSHSKSGLPCQTSRCGPGLALRLDLSCCNNFLRGLPGKGLGLGGAAQSCVSPCPYDSRRSCPQPAQSEWTVQHLSSSARSQCWRQATSVELALAGGTSCVSHSEDGFEEYTPLVLENIVAFCLVSWGREDSQRADVIPHVLVCYLHAACTSLFPAALPAPWYFCSLFLWSWCWSSCKNNWWKWASCWNFWFSLVCCRQTLKAKEWWKTTTTKNGFGDFVQVPSKEQGLAHGNHFVLFKVVTTYLLAAMLSLKCLPVGFLRTWAGELLLPICFAPPKASSAGEISAGMEKRRVLVRCMFCQRGWPRVGQVGLSWFLTPPLHAGDEQRQGVSLSGKPATCAWGHILKMIQLLLIVNNFSWTPVILQLFPLAFLQLLSILHWCSNIQTQTGANCQRDHLLYQVKVFPHSSCSLKAEHKPLHHWYLLECLVTALLLSGNRTGVLGAKAPISFAKVTTESLCLDVPSQKHLLLTGAGFILFFSHPDV